MDNKSMKKSGDFIGAYYQFRESIDLGADGILPEPEGLIWCLLMGIPEVPADKEKSAEALLTAIDQRTAILKAVFVEVNRDKPDEFLDQGLKTYDKACRIAKEFLMEKW